MTNPCVVEVDRFNSYRSHVLPSKEKRMFNPFKNWFKKKTQTVKKTKGPDIVVDMTKALQNPIKIGYLWKTKDGCYRGQFLGKDIVLIPYKTLNDNVRMIAPDFEMYIQRPKSA
jgi:hypothetical protein